MYHGITRENYDPPVWTQLPEEIFVEQIRFLKSEYNILSLSEVISCVRHGEELPDRAALITFDDGLQNNYSVAFPLLRQHEVPAAIFLTMDFMDTDKVFWFDELFFLIKKMIKEGKDLGKIDVCRGSMPGNDNVWDVYVYTVNKMKRISENDRNLMMDNLRRNAGSREPLPDDFKMLTWTQVLEMEKSDIIEFGVHTAGHSILTNINEGDWGKEIREPRERLSRILGREVLSFCYPNGKPEIDFNERHVEYLKKCGYVCAFTTESSLYETGKHTPYRIGRIPAGNDLTSYPARFRLSVSGM
ncbi:MAG: polysaccharide deacetylase family protein [Nitrospirae bacterium]|nr:polysaccharide deacetylase family protein [Nitrospirota bacterium]